MELVGSHHAMNLVAPALLVESRDTRPEARDLDDQLGAVSLQKLDIVGDLVILPDVPDDGAPYMALKVSIIGNPAFRPRIQIQFLGFLLAVAAALPWEHGASETRDSGRSL